MRSRTRVRSTREPRQGLRRAGAAPRVDRLVVPVGRRVDRHAAVEAGDAEAADHE